jgi:hypothetical protein
MMLARKKNGKRVDLSGGGNRPPEPNNDDPRTEGLETAIPRVAHDGRNHRMPTADCQALLSHLDYSEVTYDLDIIVADRPESGFCIERDRFGVRTFDLELDLKAGGFGMAERFGEQEFREPPPLMRRSDGEMMEMEPAAVRGHP